MNPPTKLHWGLIVIGAFLMELALVAIAIPFFLGSADQALPYVIPPAALVATFYVTVWVGRRIETGLVLHGVLIGLVGALMYVGISLAQPEPFAYLVAHGLKVLGGAAGGYFVERRRETVHVAPAGTT
jgi:hypothetical protein